MITVSYNAYCAISKEGDNDIWTVRPRGVVPLHISVGATVNALLGDTFSRENNTHGSRFHDRDSQFASRILGAMTQSCYIGTRVIRSRVIRSPYCTLLSPSYFASNQGVSSHGIDLVFEESLWSQSQWGLTISQPCQIAAFRAPALLLTCQVHYNGTGLILGLRPANERRRYKVTPSLIG